MPGYEAKFVIPVDKCLECPVCLTVLRDPVQVTPCGHRVCKTCLQPILRNKRPRCPLDNLPLFEDQVFSDNACHRQILSMDIYCRYNDKGCTWKGPLNEHKKHLDNCQLNDVSCPKNCGVSLERRKVDDHFNECDNRRTPCEHCNQMIVFSCMDVHLQSCASFPISCPLKCGVNELSKETLSSHMTLECPLFVIPCQFAHAGCSFKAERQKISSHMEGNLSSHLMLIGNIVKDQKQQMSLQRERIQLQKEHLQLQKEMLMSQRDDLVETRSKTANGEFVWKIDNFTRKLMDAKSGRATEPLISEPFYTHPHGYKMCAGIWLNGIGTGRGRYISVGLQVQVGEFDGILDWSFYPRYTFTLMDQHESKKDRKHIVATFEPQGISRPSVNRQLGKGARRFVQQDDVIGSTYCQDDVIFIKFNVGLKQQPSGFFAKVS